jgi:hypothetical protein
MNREDADADVPALSPEIHQPDNDHSPRAEKSLTPR